MSLSTVAAEIVMAAVFITQLSAIAVGEPAGAPGWMAVALGF